MLERVKITDFTCESREKIPSLDLSYEVFGRPLDSGAPVVLVFHALTGNSNVCGDPHGWWRGLIYPGGTVDTDRYTILCFNIPGNGYDGFLWGDRYARISARDVVRMFIEASRRLGVEHFHTLIGGSLGGCLVWEAIAEYPECAGQAVIVAGDWKATDWVTALSVIQLQLLARGEFGMHDARMMTMLFFRSPESIDAKFSRTMNRELGVRNIQSWLEHHGEKLQGRFSPDAYRFMMHMITTVDISRGRGSFEQAIRPFAGRIIQVGITSDLYFPAYENVRTQEELMRMRKDAHYLELDTPHGHDGFLIEFTRMRELLGAFF